MLVGIDPNKEDALTSISSRLVQGRMIEDYGLLVGEGILKNLKIKLNDTMVLISQGYHGANAANQYPIVGVVHFASPELNKQLVMMPLTQAQDFFGTSDNQLTSLVMNIQEKEVVPEVLTTLKSTLADDPLEVMDWESMMPELTQAKSLDTAGANIMLLILYIIISFGIFGTILMMTKDRAYEFGILVSIGMRKSKLMVMLWLEIVIIGLIGALAGIGASMLLVKYFELNPIKLTGEFASAYEAFGMEPLLPAAFDIPVFLFQAFAVLTITTIMATYPAYVLWKLKPVEAMKT
jgi:ABC-type lipoprotein release transport system permease subunit